MSYDDKPYALGGNSVSDQAEQSTANRGGGIIAIRTLVELQVLSMLLNEGFNLGMDLTQLRQDLSDEIS